VFVLRELKLKRSLVWLLIAALLLSTLQFGALTADAAVTNSDIADGEYEVDFNYLEDGKNSVSTANQYMKISGQKGKLIVNNGQIKFQHEMLKAEYAHFEYLGVRPSDLPRAVITHNSDTKLDDVTGYEGYQVISVVPKAGDDSYVIASYTIDDISQKQDVLMHINMLGGGYNHWYHAQLWIDTSSFEQSNEPEPENPTPGGPETPVTGTPVKLDKLNDLITLAQQEYQTSVEGIEYGQYPLGSRSELLSAITTASINLIKTEAGNEAAYGAIYATLEERLTHFKSLRKLADMTELKELLATLNQFMKTAKPNGAAQGEPGGATTAIVAGEYSFDDLNTMQNQITRAQAIIDNPATTPGTVDQHKVSLLKAYQDAERRRYVAHQPLSLYVLDTDQPTSTQSIYADEVSPTVTTVIQKNNYDSMNLLRGNITLKVAPKDNLVKWFLTQPNGGYLDPEVYEQFGLIFKGAPERTQSTEQEKVYQGNIRWEITDEFRWNGLGKIIYTYQDVKRSLYLSFNRTIHEELQQSLAFAERLHAEALKTAAAGENQFEQAKAALNNVIQQAKPIASNLNATKPQIEDTAAALEQAVTAFKAVAVFEQTINFTAVQETLNTFSQMDNYFAKPATYIHGADGKYTVALTLKRSSEIPEFKVESNGEWVNASVVEQNTAADTRVVSFILNNLDSLVNASVRVVLNQGQLYDQTHKIRLNFNGVDNSSLVSAWSNATTKLRQAKVGSLPGQYSQAAVTAFKTSIDMAGAVAVNTKETEAQTLQALQQLQQAIVDFESAKITLQHLPDGDYKLDYTILKKDEDKVSVMQDYVKTPGVLRVKDGKSTFFMTLTQHAEITGLKFNNEAVTNESVNTAANERVVSFLVTDVTSIMNGWVKIDWAAINYHNEYDIRIQFKTDSLEPIASTPGGEELADGSYLISYNVLKDGTDQTSIIMDYVVSPALLKVEGDKKTIAFTVKQSKEVHTIKLNGLNQTVIGQDTAANTRIVSFELSGISDKQQGQVHIDWPELNYHSQYTVQFQFDQNSLKRVSNETAVPGDNGNVEPIEGEELYYSILHATKAEFSTLNGYLSKPAIISRNLDGSTDVTVTIFDSTTIKELKVKQDGVYVDASTISEDTAANTRNVTFTVTDFATPLDAKVRVVTPYQGQVHDATYDVRFMFNNVDNTVLQTVVDFATTLKRQAKVGVQEGQYTDAAIQALQVAITAAHQAGAQIQGTQDHSDAALEALIIAIGVFRDSAVKKQLSNGNYQVTLAALEQELATHVETAASLVANNQKYTLAMTPKPGVTITKLVNVNTFAEILPVNANNSGLKSLSAASQVSPVAFEIEDLNAEYLLFLQSPGAAGEVTYVYPIQFTGFTSGNNGSTPGTNPDNSGGETGGLTDGAYLINYRVLKDGEESTSIMADYVVSPALLTVQSGRKTVSFTVKQSKQVHTITMNGSNQTIVSQDAGNNTRVISFELTSLSGKQQGHVKIDWPEYNYNNKAYDVQFVFDESSIKSVSSGTRPPGGNGEVGIPNLEEPGATPTPSTSPNPTSTPKPGAGTGEAGGGGTGQTPAAFKDTEKHWAQQQVSRAVARGVVSGYADGSFRPEQTVNRGEFATMISRALKLGGDTAGIAFKDEESTPLWARSHVALALKAGLLSGYADQTFRAGNGLTRAELAVIVAKAAGLQLDDKATTTFKDQDSIPVWARKAVAAASAAGLIQGDGNNRFDPNRVATRAEAVTFVNRLLDLLESDAAA
jgi:heme-binding NEAT domain protein